MGFIIPTSTSLQLWLSDLPVRSRVRAAMLEAPLTVGSTQRSTIYASNLDVSTWPLWFSCARSYCVSLGKNRENTGKQFFPWSISVSFDFCAAQLLNVHGSTVGAPQDTKGGVAQLPQVMLRKLRLCLELWEANVQNMFQILSLPGSRFGCCPSKVTLGSLFLRFGGECGKMC